MWLAASMFDEWVVCHDDHLFLSEINDDMLTPGQGPQLIHMEDAEKWRNVNHSSYIQARAETAVQLHNLGFTYYDCDLHRPKKIDSQLFMRASKLADWIIDSRVGPVLPESFYVNAAKVPTLPRKNCRINLITKTFEEFSKDFDVISLPPKIYDWTWIETRFPEKSRFEQ